MNVGYAQSMITPSLDKPAFLAGFGTDRRAQTLHDDLYARAVAMQSDRTTIILVALDLIGFMKTDVQDVIQRVCNSHPQVQIVIASTHTHHGPDTIGLWGPDWNTCGVDFEYIATIKEKIASTILTSLRDLRPASIKYTSVHVSGVAKNARNPEIVDDELTITQFVEQVDNLPQVSLFNFSCHPEVLGEHNPSITSDYVGYLRDEVEKQTSAPCIFFAGALGGMMTPDVKDHSFEEAEYMGRKLATEGLKALNTVNGQSPTISMQKREIQAKLTNILYKMAFERKLLLDVRDKKGYVHSEVNLIRLGALWLATVPGELLPELGFQLKAWMKEAGANVAGVIGLANDELGYILPIEDFKYPRNPFQPGKHYEETNSIGKGIAPSVMSALQELIRGK